MNITNQEPFQFINPVMTKLLHQTPNYFNNLNDIDYYCFLLAFIIMLIPFLLFPNNIQF